MKTHDEGQAILQVAQNRCQTASLLCWRVQAQRELVQHELSNLSKRLRVLREMLDQLRESRGVWSYAPARQHDREVVALINILQRLPVSSRS